MPLVDRRTAVQIQIKVIWLCARCATFLKNKKKTHTNLTIHSRSLKMYLEFYVFIIYFSYLSLTTLLSLWKENILVFICNSKTVKSPAPLPVCSLHPVTGRILSCPAVFGILACGDLRLQPPTSAAQQLQLHLLYLLLLTITFYYCCSFI